MGCPLVKGGVKLRRVSTLNQSDMRGLATAGRLLSAGVDRLSRFEREPRCRTTCLLIERPRIVRYRARTAPYDRPLGADHRAYRHGQARDGLNLLARVRLWHAGSHDRAPVQWQREWKPVSTSLSAAGVSAAWPVSAPARPIWTATWAVSPARWAIPAGLYGSRGAVRPSSADR
jgi:hypothetical protein